MNALNLTRTEANVVIVHRHSDGSVRVEPQWECTATGDQLAQIAADGALAFAEYCGGGYVTTEIHDYR